MPEQTATSEPPVQDTALDRRYDALTHRIAATSAGRLGLKIAVFVLGLAFVLGGFALVVLPGPLTIPPILVGVYIWSLEFTWAQRLRVRVSRSAQETWENAKKHPAKAIVVTVGGLVLAGVAIWAVTHYELVAKLKDAIS